MLSAFLLSVALVRPAVAARDAVELAILNQALPSALPADPEARVACGATWTISTTGDDVVTVAPDCPMKDAVQDAANQWRFGYRKLPKDTTTFTVLASFRYDTDKNGVLGWFYEFELPDADRGAVSAGETPPTPVRHPAPAFPPSTGGVNTADCSARFTTDARGAVTQVLTYGCPEPFQVELLKAAHAWTFRPAVVDGAPVGSAFTLTVKFRNS